MQFNHKEEERKRIDEELPTFKGNRDRRAELNIRRKNLLPRISTLESELQNLKDFQESLQNASLAIVHLQTCPICGSRENPLHSHQNDCFEITCSDCKATWGLRYNPDRKIRIPIIQSGKLPNDYTPERVDDVLGCDVLSVPVIGENGKIEFLSPRQVPCSMTCLPGS